ncbi:MAG: hypothetical protein K0Q97_2434 [Bacillota bacterium]|nr:hypothetical protein [Bacillota bacterium]
MKLNKKLIIFLVVVFALNLTACANDNENNSNNQTNESDSAQNKNAGNEYTAQGRIVKIDEEGIHIQNKDKVDIYKVSKETSGKYYAGEFVGINALSTGDYEVISDENYDYNKRYTSEGNEIKRVTGTIGDINDDRITTVTEMGDLEFINTGDFDLKPESQVMFDYVEMSGGNQVVSFYDEASKITVNVKEISRGTAGTMKIYATAADNKEYDINVGPDAGTNFAHSSLKVDDEITVYPETITGNIPAQVEAKLVVRNEDK